MSVSPTIVVQAYRRAHSLSRLLASLLQASYPAAVTLVISIDGPIGSEDASSVAEVRQLAHAFSWPHGPCRVIAHEERPGLVAHHIYCLSLAEQYGAIILLEDDLVVSRTFYRYAEQAQATYGNNARIAGISLNALWYNGLTRQPFIPLPDAFDVFFLQLGTPQGQLYTAGQWLNYKQWLVSRQGSPVQPSSLHASLVELPLTDWLPVKDQYLLETDRLYVYPRESQTVNFGDVGTHFDRPTAFFQVALQERRDAFRFASPDESLAVYDSFFELMPDKLRLLAAGLEDTDFDIDLYATKTAEQLTRPYVITTRPAQNAIWTRGKWLRPLELNLMGYHAPGKGISLARREDVDLSRHATLAAQHSNTRYFRGDEIPGLRQELGDRLKARLVGRRT